MSPGAPDAKLHSHRGTGIAPGKVAMRVRASAVAQIAILSLLSKARTSPFWQVAWPERQAPDRLWTS